MMAFGGMLWYAILYCSALHIAWGRDIAVDIYTFLCVYYIYVCMCIQYIYYIFYSILFYHII